MATRSGSSVRGEYYEALLEFLRVAETIWEASRLFFGRWDLSPSQFNVLNVLRERAKGMSQVELSRALITHRSNVTGLVDRLEKRGLVARREGEGDRRAYCVVLTPDGRRLMEEILPGYHAAVEALWIGISPHQAKALVRQLRPVGERARQAAQARSRSNGGSSTGHPSV